MDTFGTPPPLDFEIEPAEGSRVLYLRVAPKISGGAARAMIFFTLKATNNTDQPLTVEELTVTFPGTNLKFEFPSREVVIPPHETKHVGLKNADEDKKIYAEEIELDQFPTKIKITLAVPELPGGTVWRIWDLGPHAKSYDFFARPEEGDFGEFIQLQRVHYFGGGNQHFGQDANVVGWNHKNGKLSKNRTDGKTNADTFLWRRPIYAMADGTVVRAVSRHPDNPSPDERMFNAKNEGSEYETPFSVDAIAVAALSSSRMLLAAIKAGKLHLTCLDQDPAGEVLTKRGDRQGPAAERIAVAGLDSTRALTAAQKGEQCELTLWRILEGGSILPATDKVTMPDVLEVKILAVLTMGATKVAVTAARTVQGTLALGAWRIVQQKFPESKPHATATSSVDGAFEGMALDAPGRVATAARQGDGRMKLTVWDLDSEGGGEGWGGNGGEGESVPTFSIKKRGEASTSGKVSEVSVGGTGVADRIGTAVRTEEETLKVIVWQVDPAGNVKRRESVEEPGDASLIRLSYFKSSSVLVAFRTGSGTLRVISWAVNEDENFKMTFQKNPVQDRGPTDLIAIGRVPTAQPTVVTAVRTTAKTAKVILWQFSDSNGISILHGDELVHFFHLHQDSIPDTLISDPNDDYAKPPFPKIKRGDRIGTMGHSGKSGGPHLHMHIHKVRPELVADVALLVEEFRKGADLGPFRPLQFHGVLAMREQNVKPGWKNNPMSEMKGEGAYFDKYVVWPWDGEPPACVDLRADIKALEQEIKALEAEIDDLQAQLAEAAPASKGPIADQIKKKQDHRSARVKALEALRTKATRLGCLP